MNHPAASPSQKRLDAIRNRISLASPVWGVAADGEMTLTAGADEAAAQPVTHGVQGAAFGVMPSCSATHPMTSPGY